MHYLVDGYNLFFKLQEEILPLEQKREEFIALLDQEVGDLHLNVSLIFDSHYENATPFASKRKLQNIEVIFSPKKLTADQYILELLGWDAKKTTLVTSDRDLAKKGKHLGAKTQSIETFVAFIMRRQKRKASKGKPEMHESDANMKRLLKEFEKRLDEIDEQ